MANKYKSTLLVNDNTPNEVRKADLDLLKKINEVNDSVVSNTTTLTSGLVTLNNKITNIVDNYKNKIINGSFNIWQRGLIRTILPADGPVYIADRWRFSIINPSIISAIVEEAIFAAPVRYPIEPSPYTELSITSSQAGTGKCIEIIQSIENINSITSKFATLSFYAAYTNAPTNNKSKLTININQRLSNSSVITGLSPVTKTISYFPDRYEITFPIPYVNNATTAFNENCIELVITLEDVTTGGKLKLMNVQLEEGSIATSFERRHIGTELAMCKRYYEANDFVPIYQPIMAASGIYYGPTSNAPTAYLPTIIYNVEKRDTPFLSIFDLSKTLNYVTAYAKQDLLYSTSSEYINAFYNTTKGVSLYTSTNGGTIPGSGLDLFLAGYYWTADAEFY